MKHHLLIHCKLTCLSGHFLGKLYNDFLIPFSRKPTKVEGELLSSILQISNRKSLNRICFFLSVMATFNSDIPTRSETSLLVVITTFMTVSSSKKHSAFITLLLFVRHCTRENMIFLRKEDYIRIWNIKDLQTDLLLVAKT